MTRNIFDGLDVVASVEELDRELSIELAVVGGVYEPGSPLADGMQDHVAPDDRSRREDVDRLVERFVGERAAAAGRRERQTPQSISWRVQASGAAGEVR
jgi:hypothetical protein